MAGRAVFPGLDDPETTIYPVMGTELFPAFFTGIFLVVVLAGIMWRRNELFHASIRILLQKPRQFSGGSNVNDHRSPIRMTPAFFFLMLALTEGSRHGHAMARDVEERSGGSVNLSLL